MDALQYFNVFLENLTLSLKFFIWDGHRHRLKKQKFCDWVLELLKKNLVLFAEANWAATDFCKSW